MTAPKVLMRRLQRVRALMRAATTEGERVAATNAAARLERRLKTMAANDPVLAMHREVTRGDNREVLPDPIFVGGVLPSLYELKQALRDYESGERTRGELRYWAMKIIDEALLPEEPFHPQAPLAEVLLFVGSHQTGLNASDVGPMIGLLDQWDWPQWFELVAAAYARRSA